MIKRLAPFFVKLTVIFVVILCFSASASGSPKISSVILTSYSNKSLILYFKVRNAFNEDLKRAILSGFPIKFRFYVKIISEPDRNVLYDRVLINSITYDELNNNFILNYNYNSTKLILSSFNNALMHAARVQNLSIHIKKNFMLNHRYLITIKGILGASHIPFPLNYIPFIGGYFLTTTNVYSLKFIY